MFKIRKTSKELIITVNIEKLKMSINGNVHGFITITDMDAFLPELISSIKSEDESGASIIHRAFDEAANNAAEDGAYGIKDDE